MQQYKDVDGDSGVIGYKIGIDSIIVQFKGGATYLYNYESAGNYHVDQMKQLANSGDGLNSYINRHTKKLYASKL